MKKLFVIIFFSTFGIISCPLHADDDYVKITDLPDNNFVLNDIRSIAVSSNGFVAQIGSRVYPMIRTLWSNGTLFTAWELPVESDYFFSGTELPAGTSFGNEFCLLLNNRLEFFTPDGEYIRYVNLSPRFTGTDLKNVSGMAYELKTDIFHFLLKSEQVVWMEYTSEGIYESLKKMPSFLSSADSLFLVSTPDDVLLGEFNNNSVTLYFQNGEPVTNYIVYIEETSIFSPMELQQAVNNCMNTLSSIYPANIPEIIDIALFSTTLWFQTGEYLIHFNAEGKILDIPLAKPVYSYKSPDYAAYVAKLPDNRILWSAFSDRFFTMTGFGKNPRVDFWDVIINCNLPVVDFCVDNSSNWWILCETNIGQQTSALVLKKDDNGNIETVQLIANDDFPYSFVKTENEPVAVVGRYNYNPVENNSEKILSNPWPHNLNLSVDSNNVEVISSSATSNGTIFMCVRESEQGIPWLNQRNYIYIFNSTGDLQETKNNSAGFFTPENQKNVIALDARGNLYQLKDDETINYIASVDLVDSNNMCGFNYFVTNLFITPVIDQYVSFYAKPAYSKKKDNPPVLIRPNGKPVTYYYDKDARSLYIFGPQWNNSFRDGNTFNKLVKLGKKLEKNPEKVYRKLDKKKSKNKSKIKKITIWLNKFQPAVENLYVYAGVKKIKLIDNSLKEITSEYGDLSNPLGEINIAGNYVGNISCSQIKKLTIKNSFSGELKTWFYDIPNVNIGEECNKVNICARKDIKKIQIGTSLNLSKLRAGISPAGFSGYSGDINSVRVNGDIDSSEIIACADEGYTTNWSGTAEYDNEHFYGSIKSIAGRVLRRDNRKTFLSTAKDSLFVSKHPLKSLLIELEDSHCIINGELK